MVVFLKKILIINTPGILNRGSMAVVIGAVNSIKENIPNSYITILCHHWTTDKDTLKQLFNGKGIEIKRHPWFRVHDSFIATSLHSGLLAILYFLYSEITRLFVSIKLPIKNVYLQHDVIVDLNTDSITENYGIFPPLFCFFNMTLGIIADKPLIVLGTSIIPFKNKWLERIGKYVFLHAKLITLREELSEKYLKNTLGVNNPEITVTADFAFLLEPAPINTLDLVFHLNSNLPAGSIIGITPAYNKSLFTFEEYITILADIADSLVEQYDATVVILPHTFAASSVWSRAVSLQGDVVAKGIYQKARHKNQILTVSGTPTASELKAIIAQFDFFISFMLHPLISSMSQGVPSIAIAGYNHLKFRGILSMVAQSDCIIHLNGFNRGELKSLIFTKLAYMWPNRIHIHDDLVERTKIMKQRSMLNGCLLKNWLNENT